jgi:hypothetical protein
MAGISLTRVTANPLKSNNPVYWEEAGTDPGLSAREYPDVYRLWRGEDELPQIVRLRRDFGKWLTTILSSNWRNKTEPPPLLFYVLRRTSTLARQSRE